MKKYIWKIILIISMIILLFSCSPSLRTRHYVVESVRGYTVKLKGVDELFSFPTDTLKPGDTIFVKRVFKEKNANIW